MASPAETYEAYFVPSIFAPLAQVVLSRAAPRPGERALDLACGTGVLARALAPAVGTAGRVMGIDLRPGMLAVARDRAVADGVTVDWRQADACALDLPAGELDLIVCQQGLQFFPDRAGALRHVHRALAPGGRVVFACWRSIEHQALWCDLLEVERRHLAALGADADDAVAPFSLGDAAALRTLLGDAGFTDVEVEAHTLDVAFPAAGFIRSQYQAYAAVMPQLADDPDAFEAFVAAIEADTRALVARYTRGGHVRAPMHTHVAVARR